MLCMRVILVLHPLVSHPSRRTSHEHLGGSRKSVLQTDMTHDSVPQSRCAPCTNNIRTRCRSAECRRRRRRQQRRRQSRVLPGNLLERSAPRFGHFGPISSHNALARCARFASIVCVCVFMSSFTHYTRALTMPGIGCEWLYGWHRQRLLINYTRWRHPVRAQRTSRCHSFVMRPNHMVERKWHINSIVSNAVIFGWCQISTIASTVVVCFWGLSCAFAVHNRTVD